jgi:mRNA interferase MazF
MTRFEFGDIVLVPFPFTDQSATKKRPAVVISSAAYNAERPDLIIMAVTSQIRPTSTIGEVAIQGWQSAGLL